MCRGGTCTNTDGSYKCLCPPGHELVAEGTACEGERASCPRGVYVCTRPLPVGVCVSVYRVRWRASVFVHL